MNSLFKEYLDKFFIVFINGILVCSCTTEEQDDVPHHGRSGPRSPRKEEFKLRSPMVSYKGPITRLRAKFVNLVTYLDDKGAFGSIEGH